jgi:hypothetical protein
LAKHEGAFYSGTKIVAVAKNYARSALR